MNIPCNIENSNCIYRAKHKLTVLKNNIAREDEYYISIHLNNITNDTVKLTIINAVTDVESYTSIISHLQFEQLKKSQNLYVAFDEFCTQIKNLLYQYEQKTIEMRLTINNEIILEFYTRSNLKELIILIIPLEYTSTEEIISYLRKKITNLETSNKMIIDKNEMLKTQLSEITQKYDETICSLDQVNEKYKITAEKLEEVKKSCDNYKNILDENNKQKFIMQNELRLGNKKNLNLNQRNLELKSDLNSLKNGLEYYIAKTKRLESLLIEKEKSTVPVNKYEKVNSMFCSAIADLLKCQINFKRILSLHEMQKSENSSLKEELTKCIDIIKNLENKIQEGEVFNKNASNSDENLNEIDQIIKKLESQSTK